MLLYDIGAMSIATVAVVVVVVILVVLLGIAVVTVIIVILTIKLQRKRYNIIGSLRGSKFLLCDYICIRQQPPFCSDFTKVGYIPLDE